MCLLMLSVTVYAPNTNKCLFQFHEERQMAWDQREVELERQLDIFDRQQNEILSAAQKVSKMTMFDASLI